MAENRVALVTGASSGIGRGIALRFGSRGMRVGLAARRDRRLKEVASQIEGSGGKALAFPGDVRDSAFAQRAVDTVVDAWGRIDILVNNAGIGHYALVEKLSDESVREQFEVNVFGPFYFTRAVGPHLKKQKSGQIVNIGSMAGLVGFARGTAYVATKWALTVNDVVHAVETIVDQGPNSDIREIVVQVRDRS